MGSGIICCLLLKLTSSFKYVFSFFLSLFMFLLVFDVQCVVIVVL
jgi:hypothetical protein